MICTWDVSDFGEPRKMCGEPVTEGRKWCDRHLARLPIWPTGEVEHGTEMQAPKV